jgi:mono/diheme cytochrome c family protein
MNRVLLCLISAFSAAAMATETKVKLPSSRADLATGAKLFENHCGRCHGPKGEGGRGPMLSRAKLSRAPNDVALVKVIEDGIRGTEMPGAGSMTDREMRQTAAYVRSLGKVPLKPPPGDPARGAEIYRGKGACAGCHSIRGEGGISAPDLAGIGGTRSAGYLHEALVDPEAAVPEGYLLVKVPEGDPDGSPPVLRESEPRCGYPRQDHILRQHRCAPDRAGCTNR